MDMSVFSWLTDLFTSTPSEEPDVESEKERARDPKGRFIPDDPDTPENEAYK
tara:strand:- start:65 stop:220 length:156 start_codon:yes stop_codon:yes gene_type:complete